jgi:penicillin-binding protein 1C
MPVRFGDEIEAARDEWFIAGTEQPLFATDHAAAVRPDGHAAARIVSPSQGTVIALDPDIPPRHQRLRFASDGGDGAIAWRIDGKPFARGASAQWLPWPGRHLIELVDARGNVLDARRIEVRGAGVKQSARPGDNGPMDRPPGIGTALR